MRVQCFAGAGALVTLLVSATGTGATPQLFSGLATERWRHCRCRRFTRPRLWSEPLNRRPPGAWRHHVSGQRRRPASSVRSSMWWGRRRMQRPDWSGNHDCPL